MTEIRNAKAKSDPQLQAEEQETIIRMDKQHENIIVYSDIPVHIRYLRDNDDADIIDATIEDDAIYSIKAKLPKGYLKLKGKPRESNNNSPIV